MLGISEESFVHIHIGTCRKTGTRGMFVIKAIMRNRKQKFYEPQQTDVSRRAIIR